MFMELEVKRVFLLDNYSNFRKSLAFLLDREPDLKEVAQADSLAQARNGALQMLEEFDVAVVDLLLPDGIGTSLIKNLRDARPDLPVIVLTMLDDRVTHDWALAMGANEVLAMITPPGQIAAVIRNLAQGANGRR